jgi:proprotein convertase subtilisin/kexin type 5
MIDVKCPDGTYPSLIDRKCLPCDPSCVQCTGPNSNDCSSCPDSYYFIRLCKNPVDGTLVPTKSDGFSCVDDTFIVVNTCQPCFLGCAKCVGLQNNDCSSCLPNYFSYPL